MMPKILVVDDDPDVRAYMKEVLVNSGYEADAASNGHDAIRMQKDQLCDLVITDILMPMAEGLSTIQKFRRRFPDTKVIAMSGGGVLGMGDYLSQALLFGADATLEKPIRSEALLNAVDDLMSSDCKLLTGFFV
jgi:CheY-like chemotaxis protein